MRRDSGAPRSIRSRTLNSPPDALEVLIAGGVFRSRPVMGDRYQPGERSRSPTWSGTSGPANPEPASTALPLRRKAIARAVLRGGGRRDCEAPWAAAAGGRVSAPQRLLPRSAQILSRCGRSHLRRGAFHFCKNLPICDVVPDKSEMARRFGRIFSFAQDIVAHESERRSKQQGQPRAQGQPPGHSGAAGAPGHQAPLPCPGRRGIRRTSPTRPAKAREHTPTV